MASTSRTDSLPGVSYIYKMIHYVLRNCVDSEDILIKFDKKIIYSKEITLHFPQENIFNIILWLRKRKEKYMT
jgi:hypothetical protein